MNDATSDGSYMIEADGDDIKAHPWFAAVGPFDFEVSLVYAHSACILLNSSARVVALLLVFSTASHPMLVHLSIENVAA